MASDAVTDVELVTLARAGDLPALAGLLERHRPSLYAAAVSLLGSRADALDAVQDTSLIALARLGELRDPAAAKAWLHAVLRNACLMRLRRRREIPTEDVGWSGTTPSPEDLLDQHAMREWVWQAVESLNPDERLTVILRYFSRCTSYAAIAQATGAPLGTVRSRLNRARTQLAVSLGASSAETALSRRRDQAQQQAQWEQFYRALHERPVPTTYRDLFAADVDVRDPSGHWCGLRDWSRHEREAIGLGVRARLLDVVACETVTVLEIDFINPDHAPDHCPAHATFVHRTRDGFSTQLRIHYPKEIPAS